MSIATQFNFQGSKQSRVDNAGFEYIDLASLYNKMRENDIAVVQVQGFYITHGGLYGDSPVMIASDANVNLPKHLLPTVKAILDDPVLLKQVMDGKLGVKVYGYHSDKYKKDCFSVRWVDLEEEPDLFDDSETRGKLAEACEDEPSRKKAALRKGLVSLKENASAVPSGASDAIPF